MYLNELLPVAVVVVALEEVGDVVLVLRSGTAAAHAEHDPRHGQPRAVERPRRDLGATVCSGTRVTIRAVLGQISLLNSKFSLSINGSICFLVDCLRQIT